MAEAIAFPSLPPASPWDAYLLMLAIPFILRMVFVMPPLIDLVNTYAPPGERTKHLRWFSARLKKLPIEGFWLIVANEVLAFLLPAIIAITARIWFGPIGWPSWEQTPQVGVALLLIAGAAWLVTDFTKVTRSRRNIQLLAKYNLSTAKFAVEAAVVGREILKGVGDIEIPRPWRDVSMSSTPWTVNMSRPPSEDLSMTSSRGYWTRGRTHWRARWIKSGGRPGT